MDSAPSLNSQNPLRVTKVFVDTPLTVISIYWVGQFIYSSLLSVSILLSSRLTLVNLVLQKLPPDNKVGI